MRFKGRSLYNSLWLGDLEEDTISVEPWRILDYRTIETQELFHRLHSLGLCLNEDQFLLCAHESVSPEEFVENIWWEETSSTACEEAYLLLFELWRRYLPKRRTVSIVIDDLDRSIAAYDIGEIESHHVLRHLEEVLHFLESGYAQGLDPQQVFAMIAEYSAQDLELFLYDYVLERLDREEDELARRLVDMFEQFVPERKWFDLLRIYVNKVSEWDCICDKLCLLLQEERERTTADVAFLEEIFLFLVCAEDAALMVKALPVLLYCLFCERELLEFLSSVCEQCEFLGYQDLRLRAEPFFARKCAPSRRVTKADRSQLAKIVIEVLVRP